VVTAPISTVFLAIAVYIGTILSVYNFKAVMAPSLVVTLALTPGISAV